MMTTNEFSDATVLSELSVPPPAIAEHIEKQPECRLLWAVLQEGIETYMKYAGATGRRGQRLFREVQEWIMRDDPTWLCSFVSICHILGLNPEYVRAGLQRWRVEREKSTFKQAA